jgi:hypothetical protein
LKQVRIRTTFMMRRACFLAGPYAPRTRDRTSSSCLWHKDRLARMPVSRRGTELWRTAARAPRLCLSAERRGDFKVGDRVRVTQSVIMYHTPMSKGQPHDVRGLEGVVTKFVDEYQGVPISATRPIQVMLEGSKKFIAHFEASELEKVA